MVSRAEKAQLRQRERLNIQHSAASRNLGLLYSKTATEFTRTALALPASKREGYVHKYLPTLQAPFQRSSQQVAATFYNMRREQAGLQRLPQDVNSLIPVGAFIASSVVANSDTFLGALSDLSHGSTNISEVVKASERAISQVDKFVVMELGNVEPQADQVVLSVNPDGCDFCKMLETEIQPFSSAITADFHNFCHCVFDVTFAGEAPYVQEFREGFNEELEQAQEAIRSGEAGDRRLNTGGKEWGAVVQKELTNALQSGLSVSVATAVASEVIFKVQQGIPLSDENKATLSASNFDLASLDEPRTQKLKLNSKNSLEKVLKENRNKKK